MSNLRTSEAATMLNVSSNTLRSWERRFGFPKPRRSAGGHRLFAQGEVSTLRDALQDGLSISSAVSRAREGLASDRSSLVGALISYDQPRADAAIESSLALRCVTRTVEEVLLPSLQVIARRHTVDSAAWAFAAHWGADWLRTATRLAPRPTGPVSIIVGDASRDELDPDHHSIRALELFCVRAGMNVLDLSARGLAGIGDAVAAHQPNLIVIAGGHLDDDAVARWAYSVRLATGAMPLAVYRRGHARARMRAAGTHVLPLEPGAAQAQLLKLFEADEPGRARTDVTGRQPSEGSYLRRAVNSRDALRATA
jgi:MerR family transcriptional regulator, light-induced transcriptional regulator